LQADTGNLFLNEAARPDGFIKKGRAITEHIPPSPALLFPCAYTSGRLKNAARVNSARIHKEVPLGDGHL